MALNIFKKNKAGEREEIKDEEAKIKTETKKAVQGGIVRSILKRPHLTEKATRMSSERKYVFLVDLKATKPSVKKEVARRYGVKVVKVNMARKSKRPRHWRYRVQKPPLLKKAVVTLEEGQKLEIT